MLLKFRAELARALPKHLDADRIARIALTSFRHNHKLAQCDPRSVFAAVIMASQLGLEIGVGGQAYLVPYKDKSGRYECQFVPGWQGLLELMQRTGRADAWTGAVYDGDEFDFCLGDMPYLKHKPSGMLGRELTAVYAVGRKTNSQWPIIEVWPVDKLREHRDRYNRQGEKHYSFENFELYGRKVALLQVLKYLPKSVELQTAIQLQHAADSGSQNLTYRQAIEGTWLPEESETGMVDVEELPTAPSATEDVKDQLKARRGQPNEDIWPPRKKQTPESGAA